MLNKLTPYKICIKCASRRILPPKLLEWFKSLTRVYNFFTNTQRLTDSTRSYPWQQDIAPMNRDWTCSCSPRYFTTILPPILNPTAINLLSGYFDIISSTITPYSSVPPEPAEQSNSISAITRKLSYLNDDRAMRPIYECPEKFRESLTMPTATFAEIVIGFSSD